MNHLQLVPLTITVDAGTCISVQLDARDVNGMQVANPGPTLSWELRPPAGVQTFNNPACTISPGAYLTSPLVQTGYLWADKFGQSSVYPTIVTPPTGYAQGRSVQVSSVAKLSGFPASLPYNVCTPVTLTASALALDNTDLNLTSSGTFTFNSGGCVGTLSAVTIYSLSNSATGYVRSNTGGMVQISTFTNVLRFNPLAVTLTRPDAGTPCLGDGDACSTSTSCCSDVCLFSACKGVPLPTGP